MMDTTEAWVKITTACLELIEQEVKEECLGHEEDLCDELWQLLKIMRNNEVIEKHCRTCSFCKHTSESFVYTQKLNVSPGEKHTSVQELIFNFTKNSTIKEPDTTCVRCSKKGGVKCKVHIHAVGDELRIQLGRAAAQNMRNVNWRNVRDYGADVDLDEYLLINGAVYEVKTTVNRTRGRIAGGHYYTDIKVDDKKWFRANDETVAEANPLMDKDHMLLCLVKTHLLPGDVGIKNRKNYRKVRAKELVRIRKAARKTKDSWSMFRRAGHKQQKPNMEQRKKVRKARRANWKQNKDY